MKVIQTALMGGGLVDGGLYSLIFLVAGLYAAVGHGGASGYLAVMSLFTDTPPHQLAVTALVLNLLVSSVSFITYYRAGYFNGRLSWPFMVTSVPVAFLGGLIPVTAPVYYGLLSGVLTLAAVRMGWPESRGGSDSLPVCSPSYGVAMGTGALIGLISGMIGVGGGIFLSPLMLMGRWADPKQTSATAAGFIWVNSWAGLLGKSLQHPVLWSIPWPVVIVALLGGVLGSYWGAHRLSNTRLRQILAVILLIAVGKLLMKCF